MDTIAGLVATYENVAMDTVEASLKLNISLNAVISMLVEIMPTQPTGAAALPPRPPGVAEQEAIEEQKERVRKIEEARERRFALAAEKARLLEEKRLREEEEAAVREALGLDSPDDSPRLSIRKETNSVVAEDPNTHEDSKEIHGDAALVDSVDGDDFSSGNEGVEVENILDVETEDAAGDENNSDFPVVSSEKGAAVNSETARGEISDPDNALARDPNQSADAPSAENKIVPPNGSDNLAAGGDDDVGCKEANEDVPEESKHEGEEISAGGGDYVATEKVVEDVPEESKHDEEEEISCPELGDDPVIDTRVTKQWVDWMDFIMAIRDNFGRELAVLLEWR